MARQARETSQLKVYHAILRGVNKQQIFECTEDYEQFVRILQRQCGLPIETRPSKIYAATKSYKDSLDDEDEIPQMVIETEESHDRHCYLYSWCLMGNHVHLLIKESDEPIGDVMKRISSSYVYYYNHKYNRIGHLFQERFKSQPVEDWEYFVTLLRYIHQNPLKPHLVEDLKDYRWSSWHEFLGDYNIPFSSIKPIFERLTLQELKELIEKPLTEDEEKGLLDIDVKPIKTGYSDEEVWRLLEMYSGATNSSQFQAIPRPLQKHYLYMVHEEGVGPRTLSRLTGVTYSVVQKATSATKERFIQEQYLKLQSPSMVGESNPEEEEWLTYCNVPSSARLSTYDKYTMSEEDDFMKYPEY